MAAHATEQPGAAAPSGVGAAASPSASTTEPINSTDFAVNHAPTESSFVTAPMEQRHPHIDTAGHNTTASSAAPAAAASAGRHTAEPSSAISATSGGLASALLASGHNITKADAQHLKQEIKNEKAVVNNLTLEEKKEATSIRAALANVKLAIKTLDRARKAEVAAEKKHRARVKKQEVANKAFLKAQEALTEATARTDTANGELDAATKARIAAEQASTHAEAKAEQMRIGKGKHDVEREGKKTGALAKVGDAERTLAESGFKKRFGCF